MRKKVDPAVELAAKTIQSEPWDLSHWWRPLVFLVVAARQECCFREWSDPYPGPVGDGDNFTCGQCRLRGPVDRVPNLYTGAEEIREAWDLGFCPLDLSCSGERLKPVSCASVFADRMNEFCNSLEKVLSPDSGGHVSWDRAQEAYWAFGHLKQHFPDWDPTGAYNGAFEEWEAECAREGLPAWGREGRPRLVPLIDRIRQERDEALTGARRAYTEIMAPAARAFTQAIGEARRTRGEAELFLLHNQDQEIRRWLSGPHEVDHGLMTETAERWASQWAAQQESNREHRKRYPDLSSRPSRRARASEGEAPPEMPPIDMAALSEEDVALIHLKAAIRRPHEKAEADAYRAHDEAVAQAERAHQKAMAAPKPARRHQTREVRDWDLLIRLAERLTKLGTRVDQAIGRFFVVDATNNRDAVIREKEQVKEELGLPKRTPPAPPPSGPRSPRVAEWVRTQAEQGRSPKQIHAMLEAEARKKGLTHPSISTIYRWIGPQRWRRQRSDS